MLFSAVILATLTLLFLSATFGKTRPILRYANRTYTITFFSVPATTITDVVGTESKVVSIIRFTCVERPRPIITF